MRAWGEKLGREFKKVEIPESGLPFGLDDQPTAARSRAEQNGIGVLGSQSTAEADGDTMMREGNGDGEAMVS